MGISGSRSVIHVIKCETAGADFSTCLPAGLAGSRRLAVSISILLAEERGWENRGSVEQSPTPLLAGQSAVEEPRAITRSRCCIASPAYVSYGWQKLLYVLVTAYLGRAHQLPWAWDGCPSRPAPGPGLYEAEVIGFYKYIGLAIV
jgi:hypothetical protein